MARWPCCINCCLVAVDALQTLPSTSIYTVLIHCPLGCSFETFAHPNNADCFFTSKTNLTACHHFVFFTCQVHQQVSLQYFCFLFLWQDIVKICSSLTWSRMIDTVCFLLLTINKILNPFSLAADFVRFFVRFGPLRTDIFVCAVILVRKHFAVLFE